MPDINSDQESDESQEDDQSQVDLDKISDIEELRKIAKNKDAMHKRVVRDNQKLRLKNSTTNTNKVTGDVKKEVEIPRVPQALVVKAQKSEFNDATSNVAVTDRSLFWLAARDLLEFNDDYEPTNVKEVVAELKQTHPSLFTKRSNVNGRDNGRGLNNNAPGDFLRNQIYAAQGRVMIGSDEG